MLHEFLRRFLPNQFNHNRDDFSFELLRTASVKELKKYGDSGQRLIRPFNVHQHSRDNSSNLKDGEMIEILGRNDVRIQKDETTLLGFMECTSDELNRIDQSTAELSLNTAIAECNIIRSNPGFSEGILLKCIDSKPLYPYLHYALFKNPDHEMRRTQIDQAIRQLHDQRKSQFGAYDEIYAIQKNSTVEGYELPSHRHAGYITILFKLLEEQTRHEDLEKSWLSWSGAREVYKHSPRSWTLQRIALHKLPELKRKNFCPFAYVLFCEFGNILNPANRLQALDTVERLRIRNCGYVSLYQVQWSYGLTSNTHDASSSSKEVFSIPDGRWERNFMRGFSQEVEQIMDKPQLANKYSGHSSGTHSDQQSSFHSLSLFQ